MLRELLGLGTATEEAEKDETSLRVAAAALLVETASIDDSFDEKEREVVKRLLQERFGLAAAEAHRLLEEGQRTRDASAQLYGFTRAIKERLDLAERIGLIEMLWEVALADGALDPFEDTLLRRIGGLIDVPDRERGLARQRVLARRGEKGTRAETEP
jgi:uncharacterized tellurite resistance protein B-like protein